MKIHFIGIGGIGVSGLANVYLQKGDTVQGSDSEQSEITDWLLQQGADVLIGHKSDNISTDIDLLIYSEAVGEDNVELVRAKELGIKCLSGAEALAEFAKDYFLIAVSGMHGKTTTASMVAKVLTDTGLDPTSFFCPIHFRQLGKSKYLVIEADDYKSKLLNYYPDILVLTNIEEEHMDWFKDLDHIMEVFKKYISQVKKILIYNSDDKNIASLILHGREVLTVEKREYSLLAKAYDREVSPVIEELRRVLKVPGEHNVSNALAALEVARALGIDEGKAIEVLRDFKGAWRRFDEKISNRGVIVVSDYAHHPTEIKATLKAGREKYPDKKIWCVFQPHQYQRTHYLFDDFVKVFQEAISEKWVDNLFITDIYDVAGRENKEIKQQVSAQKLADAIGVGVGYLEKDKITEYLQQKVGDSEVIIIMGAGNIYKLVDEF